MMGRNFSSNFEILIRLAEPENGFVCTVTCGGRVIESAAVPILEEHVADGIYYGGSEVMD